MTRFTRQLSVVLRRAWNWLDTNLLGGSDWDELVLVRRADLLRAQDEVDRVLQGINRSRSAPAHFKALTRMHLKTVLGALERLTA